MTELAKKIEMERIGSGLTKVELCKKIGISFQTLEKLKAGGDVYPSVARRVANYYKITVSKLYELKSTYRDNRLNYLLV